jgi:hypothetical protein
MRPVIKVACQRNSVCTGIFDVKFNTLLPLVYVRGLVVFHGALLPFLGACKKMLYLLYGFFQRFHKVGDTRHQKNKNEPIPGKLIE